MPEHLTLISGIETRPIVEPEVTRTVSIVTKAGRKHSEPVALALKTAQGMDWEHVPGR